VDGDDTTTTSAAAGGPGSDRDIERARRIVERSHRIVVLTGAGISTDSGIPDFRGPNGVWTKDPKAERLATLDAYLGDPSVRRAAWQSRITSPVWQAAPNPGHRALVELERQGRLQLLVTQNIDGLHHAAGGDATTIVEIHGTMREVVCMRCGDRSPMDDVLSRVRAGEDDPSCLVPGCDGILKSATISFGQNLVPEDLRRAEAAAATADLMLAVGTSLAVYPAAGLVPVAWHAGASVVIVNAEPTPFDDIASVVLRGSISKVLPQIVGDAARRVEQR
jgi:NAD-dependent deacetylase